jgi:ABC-2 type transport system ATP-binding protein
VTVLGRTWGHQDSSLRARLGIQLQETKLNEKLTVFETLRLFRSFYPEGAAISDVLALVELETKRDARFGTLSGGQKQRLAVACALVGKPDVLFLDEPTTGLDPQARRQLWGVLDRFRSGGGTILITTHYMEEAATLCDRIAIVDRGKVIALDTPKALVASLGATHIVEFALDAGSPTPADAVLRALPGVQDVRREDGNSVLVTTGVHVTVPALLSRLESDRASLALLATHSATLEDVFVSLTGRHLRDA